MVLYVPYLFKRMVLQMIRTRLLSAVLSIFILLSVYTVAYCAESNDGEENLSEETEDIEAVVNSSRFRDKYMREMNSESAYEILSAEEE